jgi:hypothetical protein
MEIYMYVINGHSLLKRIGFSKSGVWNLQICGKEIVQPLHIGSHVYSTSVGHCAKNQTVQGQGEAT